MEFNINKVIEQQRAWINGLSKLTGERASFKMSGQYAQGEPDNFQKKWIYLMEDVRRDYVVVRSIMPMEIVFDFDTPTWEDARDQGRIMTAFLDKIAAPYLLAYSGGKGLHIHLFMDMSGIELPDIKSTTQAKRLDLPLICREMAYSAIIRLSKVDPEKAKLDRLKVSWSLQAKGSMIREFGCRRGNGSCKTLITSIPDVRPDGKDVVIPTPEDIKFYDITQLGKDVVSNIRETIETKVRYIDQEEAEPVMPYEGDMSRIPCYAELLLKGVPQGTKEFGAWFLSRVNWIYDVPQNIAAKDLAIFAARCEVEYVGDVDKILEGTYKTTNVKGFSCKWVKNTFGQHVCDRTSCPVREEQTGQSMKRQKANIVNHLNEPAKVFASQIAAISNGHKIDAWEKNTPVLDRVVRFGEITPLWAFKIFLVPEKINLEISSQEPSEQKKARTAIKRDYAKHEELLNAEYFPYLIAQFDEELLTDESGMLVDMPSKWVFPVRDYYGQFELAPPGHNDLMPDIPHYAISKKIYEAGEKYKSDANTLAGFLSKKHEGRALFNEVKARYLFHLDIEEEWATLLALWTMSTHLFWLFHAFPYIELWASFGSAKSRCLKITSMLAHLGEYVSNSTNAAMFRTIDATQCVVCIDELDELLNADKDPEIRQLIGILNSGYESGGGIPRYNMDTKRVEKFSPYSPKMVATTKGIPPHLESRCLRVEIARSSRQEFVRREPYKYKAELAKLQMDLVFWSVESGSKIAKKDVDKVLDNYQSLFVDAPLRLLQLMTPILVFYDFLGLDDAYEGSPSEKANLAKLITALVSDKETVPSEAPDQRVLLALYDAVRGASLSEHLTPKSIKCQMKLEKDEEKQWPEQRIGRILSKFNIPKKGVNGAVYYFEEKEQEPMSKDRRMKWITDLLQRESIMNSTDAETERMENGSVGPFGQWIADQRTGRTYLEIIEYQQEHKISPRVLEKAIELGIVTKMPDGMYIWRG